MLRVNYAVPPNSDGGDAENHPEPRLAGRHVQKARPLRNEYNRSAGQQHTAAVAIPLRAPELAWDVVPFPEPRLSGATCAEPRARALGLWGPRSI